MPPVPGGTRTTLTELDPAGTDCWAMVGSTPVGPTRTQPGRALELVAVMRTATDETFFVGTPATPRTLTDWSVEPASAPLQTDRAGRSTW